MCAANMGTTELYFDDVPLLIEQEGGGQSNSVIVTGFAKKVLYAQL